MGVLCSVDESLSARELGDLTEIPKSTAQRLLQTLEACGLLIQEPATRKYGLGPETLRLGTAYLRRVDVRASARPHMMLLRDQTGETVGLTVRVGSARIYIDQIEPNTELRAQNEIGVAYPLWSGAPGRVLLAEMQREELLKLVQEAGQIAFAHANPPTLDGLIDGLEAELADGYAEAFEETVPGVNTIAAPIRDVSGSLSAVLSISGPASRFNAERMHAARAVLVDAAKAILNSRGKYRN